uniref:Uncharacterized protein n=1 Tax=Raphanus sativus TaxID=3726 RepID=A0A650GB25_RAPSA|nr:hypothetical protein [Raphanus sativus]QGW48684.1 hypothetical protein [Raphanus sativus]
MHVEGLAGEHYGMLHLSLFVGLSRRFRVEGFPVYSRWSILTFNQRGEHSTNEEDNLLSFFSSSFGYRSSNIVKVIKVRNSNSKSNLSI